MATAATVPPPSQTQLDIDLRKIATKIVDVTKKQGPQTFRDAALRETKALNNSRAVLDNLISSTYESMSYGRKDDVKRYARDARNHILEVRTCLDRLDQTMHETINPPDTVNDTRVTEVFEELQAIYIEGLVQNWTISYELARNTLTVLIPGFNMVTMVGAKEMSYPVGDLHVTLNYGAVTGDGRFSYTVEDRRDVIPDGGFKGHPHVQEPNWQLCEGEGKVIIAQAMRNLRLADMMLAINQVIHSYRADGAYWRFHEGPRDGRTACRDCSQRVPPQTIVNCARCHSASCEACCTECRQCNRRSCGRCVRPCMVDNCGANVCMSCRGNCLKCQQFKCADHSSNCNRCGRNFCSDCLDENRPALPESETRRLCEGCTRLLYPRGADGGLEANPEALIIANYRPEDIQAFIDGLTRDIDPLGIFRPTQLTGDLSAEGEEDPDNEVWDEVEENDPEESIGDISAATRETLDATRPRTVPPVTPVEIDRPQPAQGRRNGSETTQPAARRQATAATEQWNGPESAQTWINEDELD